MKVILIKKQENHINFSEKLMKVVIQKIKKDSLIKIKKTVLLKIIKIKRKNIFNSRKCARYGFCLLLFKKSSKIDKLKEGESIEIDMFFDDETQSLS